MKFRSRITPQLCLHASLISLLSMTSTLPSYASRNIDIFSIVLNGPIELKKAIQFNNASPYDFEHLLKAHGNNEKFLLAIVDNVVSHFKYPPSSPPALSSEDIFLMGQKSLGILIEKKLITKEEATNYLNPLNKKFPHLTAHLLNQVALMEEPSTSAALPFSPPQQNANLAPHKINTPSSQDTLTSITGERAKFRYETILAFDDRSESFLPMFFELQHSIGDFKEALLNIVDQAFLSSLKGKANKSHALDPDQMIAIGEKAFSHLIEKKLITKKEATNYLNKFSEHTALSSPLKTLLNQVELMEESPPNSAGCHVNPGLRETGKTLKDVLRFDSMSQIKLNELFQSYYMDFMYTRQMFLLPIVDAVGEHLKGNTSSLLPTQSIVSIGEQAFSYLLDRGSVTKEEAGYYLKKLELTPNPSNSSQNLSDFLKTLHNKVNRLPPSSDRSDQNSDLKSREYFRKVKSCSYFSEYYLDMLFNLDDQMLPFQDYGLSILDNIIPRFQVQDAVLDSDAKLALAQKTFYHLIEKKFITKEKATSYLEKLGARKSSSNELEEKFSAFLKPLLQKVNLMEDSLHKWPYIIEEIRATGKMPFSTQEVLKNLPHWFLSAKDNQKDLYNLDSIIDFIIKDEDVTYDERIKALGLLFNYTHLNIERCIYGAQFMTSSHPRVHLEVAKGFYDLTTSYQEIPYQRPLHPDDIVIISKKSKFDKPTLQHASVKFCLSIAQNNPNEEQKYEALLHVCSIFPLNATDIDAFCKKTFRAICADEDTQNGLLRYMQQNSSHDQEKLKKMKTNFQTLLTEEESSPNPHVDNTRAQKKKRELLDLDDDSENDEQPHQKRKITPSSSQDVINIDDDEK